MKANTNLKKIYTYRKDKELTANMIYEINDRYRKNQRGISTLKFFSFDVDFLGSSEYNDIREESNYRSDAIINMLITRICVNGFFLSESQLKKEIKKIALDLEMEPEQVTAIFEKLLNLEFFLMIDTTAGFGYKVCVYPPFVACYDDHFLKLERDRLSQQAKRARDKEKQDAESCIDYDEDYFEGVEIDDEEPFADDCFDDDTLENDSMKATDVETAQIFSEETIDEYPFDTENDDFSLFG